MQINLNIQYKLYIPLLVGSFIFFPNDPLFVIATSISLYHFLRLLFASGEYLPMIEYTSAVFALNFLFIPVIMYSGLNEYVHPDYKMTISSDEYFLYAIPCILAYYTGLNWKNGKKFQMYSLANIQSYVKKNPYIPVLFIGLGIGAQVVSRFVPSEIQLIFAVVSNFKHVGLYLLILSGRRINPIYLVITIGFVVYDAFVTSMFNDMLNLTFFMAMIFAIRYKPKIYVKIIFVGFALLLVNFIQTIKFQLRFAVGQTTGVLTSISEASETASLDKAGKSDEEIFANTLLRFNQAWVTSTSISFYTANGFDLQYGNHLMKILASAALPTIIFPDRIKSGSGELFNEYTGRRLNEQTSVALGVPTDGFIDFGFGFGWITPLLFGLFINYFLRMIKSLDKRYIIFSVFIPIIFYYTIRPDCELQTTLGSLFKTTFIVWLFFYFNASLFRRRKVALA